jgi:hypothetical protein
VATRRAPLAWSVARPAPSAHSSISVSSAATCTQYSLLADGLGALLARRRCGAEALRARPGNASRSPGSRAAGSEDERLPRGSIADAANARRMPIVLRGPDRRWAALEQPLRHRCVRRRRVARNGVSMALGTAQRSQPARRGASGGLTARWAGTGGSAEGCARYERRRHTLEPRARSCGRPRPGTLGEARRLHCGRRLSRAPAASPRLRDGREGRSECASRPFRGGVQLARRAAASGVHG